MFNSILFACSQTATSGTSDFFTNFGPTILMVALMIGLIALMIIPQRKREKKIKNMLDSIKTGDRVRTIGGVYGTVVSVKEDVITIAVGPEKVKLVFARGAIATIEDRSDVENTIEDAIDK